MGVGVFTMMPKAGFNSPWPHSCTCFSSAKELINILYNSALLDFLLFRN